MLGDKYLVLQLSGESPVFLQVTSTHWFAKLDLDGTTSLVCQLYPTWGDQTFVHVIFRKNHETTCMSVLWLLFFPSVHTDWLLDWDWDRKRMSLCCKAVVEVIGQKTTWGSEFSPSTTWILEIQLRVSGLAASTFSYWAISTAPKNTLIQTWHYMLVSLCLRV